MEFLLAANCAPCPKRWPGSDWLSNTGCLCRFGARICFLCWMAAGVGGNRYDSTIMRSLSLGEPELLSVSNPVFINSSRFRVGGMSCWLRRDRVRPDIVGIARIRGEGVLRRGPPRGLGCRTTFRCRSRMWLANPIAWPFNSLLPGSKGDWLRGFRVL